MTASFVIPPDTRAGDGNNDAARAAADHARACLEALPYAARARAGALLRALESRLRRQLPADRSAAQLRAIVYGAQAALGARSALIPAIGFDGTLPIHASMDAIAAALAAHQVVVVSGETGSGKTTQLPRLCLALGRGRLGRIGHTQPRRVAARSVAARIAAELGPAGAALVGHKVRFADATPPTAAVKLLTDGMLLAESRADPLLLEYDTLIVDEAHERSLNIDFLLGRLRELLTRRPELHLIVASATLEPGRIARYFGNAPHIEVSGRGHPVELRYRPPTGDLPAAVVGAVRELRAAGPGDVLVFLPGEREIRDCAAALRAAALADTEVLALYARQSRAEQDRVFRAHGAPRVVLATNVAETSLTVPGVRYVVDSGLARIARYSPAGRMASLPVERIAQASAIQRAGRCGRLGPGVCIRLYDEDDYARRPAFPEPEIRRASLAAVLLQMLDLGITDPGSFAFLDPPDPRALREARHTLFALGAVDTDGTLTPTGRRLAQFPLDPRQARMLIEAGHTGALTEVLVIVAGLCVPDVRVRPHDAPERADAHHRTFADARSDFLTLLALYRAFEQASRGHSQRKARAWCEENDLSYQRLREWREVESQLRTLAHEAGLRAGTAPADYSAVHRALLAGLLDRVATREETGPPPPGAKRTRRPPVAYRGAHGTRLYLHPATPLAKRAPHWIMAAEVVETTRAYARNVAAIEPAWLEAQAAHLLARDWLEPHFDPARQDVVASERITLLGLAVVTRRRVRYARVAPQAAREIFLREALVGGLLETPSPGLARTRARITALRTLEAKTRRPDLLGDDEQLRAAWDARLPPGIASAYTFEHWRARPETDDPALLDLPEAALLAPDAALPARVEDYPDRWAVAAGTLPLRYVFDPADGADGITLTVPLAMLPGLDAESFEWLVPGWRAELFTALIRTLPKALRRRCVPAPDVARACAAELAPRGALLPALGQALARHAGTPIAAADFDADALPAHLRMRFAVMDPNGALLAAGRDLPALQAALDAPARAAFAARPAHPVERTGITHWDFGALPDAVDLPAGHGAVMRGYPALVDTGGGCALAVLESPAAAQRAHAGGLNALLRLRLAREHPGVLPRGGALGDAGLHYAPLGRAADLERELARLIVDAAFLGGRPARDAQAFEALWQAGLSRVKGSAARLGAALTEALRAYHGLRRTLRAGQALAVMEVYADLAAQLDDLVYPGFVAATGATQLAQLPRYLRAMEVRAERARTDPARDRAARAVLAPFVQALRGQPVAVRARPDWQRLRWLVEELRVSLFAQELGTAQPVSPHRLEEILTRLRA